MVLAQELTAALRHLLSIAQVHVGHDAVHLEGMLVS